MCLEVPQVGENKLISVAYYKHKIIVFHTKKLTIGNEVKRSLIADDRIVYIRDTKNTTRVFLQLKTSSVKWQDTRLTQKISSPHINIKWAEKER